MLLGIFALMAYGPVIAISFFGGILADKYDKRNIASIFQAMITLLFLIMALVAWAGQLSVGLLLAGALVESIFYSLAKPSVQAVLYDVVEVKDLGRAVPWNTSQYSVAQIIGPLLAVLIVNILGLPVALVAAGLLYLPVIIIMQTSIPDARLELVENKNSDQPTIIGSSTLGVLKVYLLSIAIGSISVEGAVRVLAPMIAEGLTQNVENAGLLISSHAVGGILGIVIVLFGQRITSEQALYRLGFAGFSFCALVFSFASNLLTAAIFSMLIGLTNAVSFNIATTLIHRRSSSSNRGRAMSLHNIALLGTRPVAGIIAGAIGVQFGWSVSARFFAVTAAIPLVIDLLKSNSKQYE